MRVLIIDDDTTFCQLLAETLEEKGIEVEWTTDGFGGYEMSLEQPYDLFILDERMPLVLGSELAEYLREDNPKAKIILTSAFADETLGDIAKRMDSPLLSKPFAAEPTACLDKASSKPFKGTQQTRKELGRQSFADSTWLRFLTALLVLAVTGYLSLSLNWTGRFSLSEQLLRGCKGKCRGQKFLWPLLEENRDTNSFLQLPSCVPA